MMATKITGQCVHSLLSRRAVYSIGSVTAFRLKATSSTSPSVVDDNGEQVSAPKPFHEIPGPGGLSRLPIIGGLFLFKPFTHHTHERFHLLADEMFERYGPIFKIQHTKPLVLISDLTDVSTVLRHEGKNPNRPAVDILDLYYKRTGFTPDLSCMQGKEWRRLRSHLNVPLMRPNIVTQYLPQLNAVSDEFVQKMAEGQTNTTGDLGEDGLFFLYAAESVGVMLFNERLGFMKNESDANSTEFLLATMSYFKYLHKAISGEAFAYKWFKDKTYREFEKVKKTIEKHVARFTVMGKKVLEAKKKDGTFDPDEPNLLLSLLNEEALTEDEVANFTEVLYAAGVDSTAYTLQNIFYTLAENQDKQDKLRDEIHEVIGRSDPVTREALNSMPYLKACVTECYRFRYPILGGVVRCLPNDLVLQGYNIPAGTQIATISRRTHREHFEDPGQFRPERWLREDGMRKEKIPPMVAWSVQPFGSGPRGCIGKRIAEQELYLAIIKAVQNYRIELSPESRGVEFVYRIFSKPITPLQFVLTDI